MHIINHGIELTLHQHVQVLEPPSLRLHRHSPTTAYQLCKLERNWTQCDGFPSVQPSTWHDDEHGGYWSQPPDTCNEQPLLVVCGRIFENHRWHTTDLWIVCRDHQARAVETDYCSLLAPHNDCTYPAWPDGPNE